MTTSGDSTGRVASSFFQGGLLKAQGSLRNHHRGGNSYSSGLRSLELVKDDDEPSFGFNIKGGIDFGVPVHIWRVEDDSLADRNGLKRGQEILQANGVDFTDISHANALKVLKGKKFLKLLINMNGSSSSVNGTKSSSMLDSSGGAVVASNSNYYRTSANQTLTSTASSMDAYTWIDRHGHPVPPPTPSLLNSNNKRIINIDINPGQNLGLMIRGGYEYGLGIYVTGVDNGSVAQRAGLQRGDELLEVNGRNFTSITHDKAVQILKSCRKMTIVANYIGKIPADNQTSTSVSSTVPHLLSSDENTELIDLNSKMNSALVTTSMSDHAHHSILMDSTNTAPSDFFDEDDLLAEEEKLNDHNLVLDYATNDSSSRLMHQDLEKSTSIMAMIEEKARTVLTKSEHSRFTFYRLEYQQGFLPIQTFVRILLELLNTVEKYTLLTEVREIIRPGDLMQFDDSVYNKQVTMGQKCGGGGGLGKGGIALRGPPPDSLMQDSVQGYHSGSGSDGMLVDMNQEPLLPLVPVSSGGNGMQGRSRISPNSAIVPFNNNYGQQQQPMEHETTFTTNQLQQQQENNRQILLTHGDTQNVVAKLNQQKINQAFVGGGPLHQNTSPHKSCVRYKVRVQKTKPILGIAIEGGSNTPHRLPRIIDVNTEGSAFGSQLKAGQVLLIVDGKKLDGLTHEEIARMILDCYVDMSRGQIEFVVVEAKSSFVQGQQALMAASLPPPPPSSGG